MFHSKHIYCYCKLVVAYDRLQSLFAQVFHFSGEDSLIKSG